MHRRPRGQQGQEKLRAIIAAARRVVLQEGLGQAKMSDIATKAKVSTATVYAYFPSKDALFHAIVQDVARDVDVRLALHLRDLSDDPIETLARMFLDRLRDGDVRALFRIMAIEGDRFPEIRDVFDTHTRLRAHEVARDLFETLAREGRFEPGAADVASRQLLGMLEHETLVIGILRGDAHPTRDDEAIALDAAKTLWARFATPSTAPDPSPLREGEAP